MEKPKSDYTLITGASSGIGLELSKVFAREGHNLVLVARRRNILKNLKKDLEKTYGIKVKIIIKDLSKPRAPKEIYKKVKRNSISVDILVNNAGFGTRGKFSETNLNTELEIIQVNISALTHLTKLFLKEMISNNKGHILNVSSVAGFMPGPMMAVYYASKAYVLSFSEALAEELHNTKIKVTTLCPGQTQTNFSKIANNGNKVGFNGYVANAKDVAEYAYKALINNGRVSIPGFKNRFLVRNVKFLPKKAVTKALRKIQERR